MVWLYAWLGINALLMLTMLSAYFCGGGYDAE